MDSVEEEAEGAPEPESFDVGDAEPVVAKGRDSWGLVGTDVQVPFQFWWPQDRSASVQPTPRAVSLGGHRGTARCTATGRRPTALWAVDQSSGRATLLVCSAYLPRCYILQEGCCHPQPISV